MSLAAMLYAVGCQADEDALPATPEVASSTGQAVLDSPGPQPAISWFGLGMAGDPGTPSRSIGNSLTGTTSCQTGSQVPFARILDPETRTGSTLFGCLANFAANVPSQAVRELLIRSDFDPAPFCRIGHPVAIARALHPELQIGINLFACVDNGSFSTSELLGLFTQDDCGTDNLANPVTGTLGCPSGAVIQSLWRLQAPESKCGEVLFACWFTGSN